MTEEQMSSNSDSGKDWEIRIGRNYTAKNENFSRVYVPKTNTQQIGTPSYAHYQLLFFLIVRRWHMDQNLSSKFVVLLGFKFEFIKYLRFILIQA